jgi:photosystem II stability/assembly factor-like uncharacterized protein
VSLPAQQRRAAATTQAEPQIAVNAYAQLRWRHIGPVGNRVSAVAGVSGDANTYYAGAASGGIWKTTDGGVHWEPVFDDQQVQSIGSLAVAAADPNVVWAGTGESFIRSHISAGWGIFKSTDAGGSWARMGLENTGRIGRIVIHPTNPDIVYAAAQGHSYGPQPERGLYRTTDGGRTWEKVLFVDENTGAIDVVMDPNNPRILFAAMWQLEIRTWGRVSGGPGSGIFRSSDGGSTWQRLSGNGLPTRPVGKIGLAIAKTNSNRIYALIETGDGVPWNGQPTDNGELWRSDNGGVSWRVVSFDRDLACRQPYYTRMAVSTDNENEAYFLCAGYSKTLDGGMTTSDLGPDGSPGGDNHDMWIDPANAGRMAVANDGGISISTTRGRTWFRIQLPIAQMYHVTVDNRIPYYVYGNKQDGPSYRGPSNTRSGGGRGGGIPRSEWHGVAGGESGWATPDPVDPNIVWSSASGSGAVGGIMTRMDLRTRHVQNVEIWPVSTGGHPAADVRYRFVWNFPLAISPHDHNKVYAGSQHVHMTTDGGRSWQVISPDLTLNDRSRQQISGGLTPDNIGVEYGDVIFAIAESPLEAGLLWVGTNDGLVQLTRDGGRTWSNVTQNLPGLPPWGTISAIEPSRFDAGTAYLTVDGHQANNRDPWIYRTSDHGRTWKLIVNGIPKSPLSYAHWIKQDPVRRGLLYAGTENAIYASFDDGENWQSLQNNLPHAPVYGITVQEHFNDLVIATYGRGFWILDDLTPLQQLTADVSAKDVHLFVPRAAYRFLGVPGQYNMTDDPTAGQNPPYGASINYWLKSAPAGDVTVTILDARGQAVRTLRGSRNAGINRVQWDLRGEGTRTARLRTSPDFAPELRVGPDGTRPAPGLGSISILMPPGRYTVKLIAGGQEFTQPLEVRKDPSSAGTEQDIAAQTDLLQALQANLNTTVDMINQVELVRAQLQTLVSFLADDRNTADIRTAADSLEQKFKAVEGNLHQLRLTGRGQDGVRWPAKLGAQIVYLANGVVGSDFAPTTQQREVQQLLDQQVRSSRGQLDQLMQRELAAFNDLLRRRNLNIIMQDGG